MSEGEAGGGRGGRGGGEDPFPPLIIDTSFIIISSPSYTLKYLAMPLDSPFAS